MLRRSERAPWKSGPGGGERTRPKGVGGLLSPRAQMLRERVHFLVADDAASTVLTVTDLTADVPNRAPALPYEITRKGEIPGNDRGQRPFRNSSHYGPASDSATTVPTPEVRLHT